MLITREETCQVPRTRTAALTDTATYIRTLHELLHKAMDCWSTRATCHADALYPNKGAGPGLMSKLIRGLHDNGTRPCDCP